jgi:hypothetical protein
MDLMIERAVMARYRRWCLPASNLTTLDTLLTG